MESGIDSARYGRFSGVAELNVGDVAPDGILYATSGLLSEPTVCMIDVDPDSHVFLSVASKTQTDNNGDASTVEVGWD